MSKEKQVEACGRCSMSTIVDAVDAATDEEESGIRDRDPFGDARIEVDEDEFRRASPAVWLSKAGAWLDETAQRITYGR